ncbi:MAG TPA: hypothetical protein VFF74_11025 [Methylophilaceae bacterium]|nr:hypothetical protein [Methylophilaceae bacterium]
MDQPIFTKHLAAHLYRLHKFLKSESLRLEAIGLDSRVNLEREAREVLELADRFQEAKSMIQLK